MEVEMQPELAEEEMEIEMQPELVGGISVPFSVVAAKVAEHLTPRDLAACCAVSVQWRDAFGSDEVWRPLCDSEIEEYLRTTPGIVEPAFSMPLQDSTLAPLGRWKMAFLREQHLWNNWRKGNCKTVEHKIVEEGEKIISLGKFVTNDFIVSFKTRSVELWDVRSLEPVLVDRLNLVFDLCKDHPPSVFENGFIVLKNHDGVFVVLKIDLTEGTILVKQQLLCCEFEQEIPGKLEICREIGKVKKDDLEPILRFYRLIITKGRLCVGYFRLIPGMTSFHVWDLETGKKLKKESCPTAPEECVRNSCATAGSGLIVVSSSTCDNVLILAPVTYLESYIDLEEQECSSSIPLSCRVYNVQKLRFFSFRRTCWANVVSVKADDIPVAIMYDFVGLTNCDTPYDGGIQGVTIFNYRTDQQLYYFDAVLQMEALADASFIFTHQLSSESTNLVDWRLCSVSGLSSSVVTDVTGSEVYDFKSIGNRFVEIVGTDEANIEEYNDALSSVTNPSQCEATVLKEHNEASEVWAFNKFSWFKTTVTFKHSCTKQELPEYKDLNYVKEVNRACSKLIAQKSVEETDVLQISHFW